MNLFVKNHIQKTEFDELFTLIDQINDEQFRIYVQNILDDDTPDSYPEFVTGRVEQLREKLNTSLDFEAQAPVNNISSKRKRPE